MGRACLTERGHAGPSPWVDQGRRFCAGRCSRGRRHAGGAWELRVRNSLAVRARGGETSSGGGTQSGAGLLSHGQRPPGGDEIGRWGSARFGREPWVSGLRTRAGGAVAGGIGRSRWAQGREPAQVGLLLAPGPPDRRGARWAAGGGALPRRTEQPASRGTRNAGAPAEGSSMARGRRNAMRTCRGGMDRGRTASEREVDFASQQNARRAAKNRRFRRATRTLTAAVGARRTGSRRFDGICAHGCCCRPSRGTVASATGPIVYASHRTPIARLVADHPVRRSSPRTSGRSLGRVSSYEARGRGAERATGLAFRSVAEGAGVSLQAGGLPGSGDERMPGTTGPAGLGGGKTPAGAWARGGTRDGGPPLAPADLVSRRAADAGSVTLGPPADLLSATNRPRLEARGTEPFPASHGPLFGEPQRGERASVGRAPIADGPFTAGSDET